MKMTTKFRTPSLDIDKLSAKRFGTVLSEQNKLERRIVARLVRYLEINGFSVVAVWDGEELEAANNAKQAMELIFNLDEASLKVKGAGKQHGILLVVGNGEDIVCDWAYTEGDPDNFNAVMESFDEGASPDDYVKLKT